MAKTVWKQAEFERHIEEQIISGLTRVGLEAKAFVQQHTPWRTGFARRSVYFAVYDARGNWVAGDRLDGNGHPVPAVLSATGQYRVTVGANAPYYVWIEVGTKGRAGHHALAQSLELIQQRMMQYTAEAKAGAKFS